MNMMILTVKMLSMSLTQCFNSFGYICMIKYILLRNPTVTDLNVNVVIKLGVLSDG